MSNRLVPLLALKGAPGELPRGRYAVDAYGYLFRYLCAYRNQRGDLFTKDGRVVSHLMGLSRLLPWLKEGREVYLVFDGKAPLLKRQVQESRRAVRTASLHQLNQLRRLGTADADELRKLAVRTSRLSPEMIESAAQFALSLGCKVVFSQGQAQPVMAQLKRAGLVDQLLTQDSDVGLYQGVSRYFRSVLVKNEKVFACCWNVAAGLEALGLDTAKALQAAILSGTDYWPGIPLIGPKKALKHVVAGSSLVLSAQDLQKIDEVRNLFETEVPYRIVDEGPDLAKATLLSELIWSSETELKRLLNRISLLYDQDRL